MNQGRRAFLKQAGRGAVGVSFGLPVLSAACSSRQDADAPRIARQLAMVIDVNKCALDEVRTACIRACHREHNVPGIPDPEEEVKWIWNEPYESAFPDQTHAHLADSVRSSPVLVLCNHCTSPSCVRVCPTGATWKRKSDGIVMMDMHRCIGCRYCIAACPYGARSFNWRDPRPYVARNEDGGLPSDYPTRTIGVVEKCNFCAERLREGRPPACVEAANSIEAGRGALTFGDLAENDSEVSRVLREKNTICRRLSLGTGPNVYYVV